MGLGIGIGIPNEVLSSNSSPTEFFEILAESGDFLIAESGATPIFLITEQQ